MEPGMTEIADYSVTEIKLANSAVSNRTIVAGAVTSAKIPSNAISSTHINTNAVSDDKIGNRTVDDIIAMSTSTTHNTGTINTLLSKLAQRVTKITGKANWRTDPAITLEALSNHSARHTTGGADALTAANVGAAATTHGHQNATSSTAGFMANTDKERLDALGIFVSGSTFAGGFPSGQTWARLTTIMTINRPGPWLITFNLRFYHSLNDVKDEEIEVRVKTSLNGAVISMTHANVLTKQSNNVSISGSVVYNRVNLAGSQDIWIEGRTVFNTIGPTHAHVGTNAYCTWIGTLQS
jgi:hypothetical protein